MSWENILKDKYRNIQRQREHRLKFPPDKKYERQLEDMKRKFYSRRYTSSTEEVIEKLILDLEYELSVNNFPFRPEVFEDGMETLEYYVDSNLKN